MIRLRHTARSAALGALLLAAGCSGTTDFSVSARFSNVATAAGSAYARTVLVDLAAQAPDAWKHRSKIKKLELVGLDGTITRVTSLPMTGSGAIWVGPGSALTPADPGVVQVGSWPSETVSAVPHSVAVALSGASLDVIENALKGDGRIVVFLTGSTVDAESFDADAVLHVKLTYKVP